MVDGYYAWSSGGVADVAGGPYENPEDAASAAQWMVDSGAVPCAWVELFRDGCEVDWVGNGWRKVNAKTNP